MAAVTVLAGRGEWFGRAAIRFAAAGMLALLVLGATLGTADSETKTEMTGNAYQFVDECLKAGGRVSQGGDEVRCDYAGGNGFYTICNVVTRVCVTHWPINPTDGSTATHREVGGGAILDDSAQPIESRPTTTTTGMATSGTMLVPDEDERP